MMNIHVCGKVLLLNEQRIFQVEMSCFDRFFVVLLALVTYPKPSSVFFV